MSCVHHECRMCLLQLRNNIVSLVFDKLLQHALVFCKEYDDFAVMFVVFYRFLRME